MVRVGESVPDFTLTGTDGGEIREYTLSEFADGRPAMLVFYVHDFSPVCTDQMCEINDVEMLTLNDDAVVVGPSPDGPYSHQRFAEESDISYPLLTDDDKRLYDQFGLIEETDEGRQHKRGIVLIDSDLTVQYRWEAEDNWDEWSVDRVAEANEIIRELI